MQTIYEVLLGVDRAAEDTGQRLRMTVRESDPLSAALKAEAMADPLLPDSRTMYTHAMRVRALTGPTPAAPALAA